MEESKLTVLWVSTGKAPVVKEIDADLEKMQSLVGGNIQYLPMGDAAAIICNEEGKIKGLPLNRALYDSNGRLFDIVAGDFFICYAPPEKDDFCSLPGDLIRKYKKQFQYPESFAMGKSGIEVMKIKPKSKGLER